MTAPTCSEKSLGAAGAYEPPALRVVASLHGLTQTGDHDFPCIWKKTIGPPDFVNWIPIANCS